MSILIVGAAPEADVAGALASLPAGTESVIVAADGGAGHCLAAGIVPDMVIGDLDSLATHTATELRSLGVDILRFPADKDESDLDLALSEARRRGTSVSLMLTGVMGGRLDHTLASVGSLTAAADLSPVLHERSLDGWVLSPTGRPALRVGPVGTRISLLAACVETTVTATGFRWPLDGDLLSPLASRGLSNIATSSNAEITVQRGVLLVLAEPAETLNT